MTRIGHPHCLPHLSLPRSDPQYMPVMHAPRKCDSSQVPRRHKTGQQACPLQAHSHIKRAHHPASSPFQSNSSAPRPTASALKATVPGRSTFAAGRPETPRWPRGQPGEAPATQCQHRAEEPPATGSREPTNPSRRPVPKAGHGGHDLRSVLGGLGLPCRPPGHWSAALPAGAYRGASTNHINLRIERDAQMFRIVTLDDSRETLSSNGLASSSASLELASSV